MLRIGRIDYANCTPIFMQIEKQISKETSSIVHGVPAELNASLARGEIDICISSSIEFTRHASEYAIMPGYCIGSDGPVKSVLLFTTRPVEEMEGEDMLVTSESATSVVLLQILMNKRWGLKNFTLTASSLPWQDALQRSPALLLIGDRALQAASHKTDGYCYDLGQEWKILTGLPFVYALWLVNRKSASGKKKALSHFRQLLEEATDTIATRAEQLAENAPESEWIEVKQLADYWRNCITYRLDAAHLSGLAKFYQFAAEIGMIKSATQPFFLDLKFL